MTRLRTWPAVLAGLAICTSACEQPKLASVGRVGPSPELAKSAVLALLPGLQFGPDPVQQTYRELRAVDVAGAHFVPAADRWVVHYCVEYLSLASDTPARRCDLSVEVYALDTKRWVGFARGAGSLYRWQVLDDAAAPASAAKPAAAAPPRSEAEPASAP